MKEITKTIKVYDFEELSQEAKDKARESFNQDEDYPFLQDDLREYIHEELTERGYTHDELTPMYSLSYCQGDGLMFEGVVYDKEGNSYEIKQSGHYYHERSTEITAMDKEEESIETEDFEENVYVPICKKVRDKGYEYIEYIQSEESFVETCEANEYNFLSNGTMVNE